MTDPELRAYLLGRLPEADAERLEQRLLEGEEVFQTLRSVEDDLIDDYARDRLDASERQGFEARYAGQTDRLTFAHALSKRTARSNVIPFARRQWIPLAAAAALVVATFGIMMRPPGEAPDRTPVPGPPAPPPPAIVLTLGISRSAAAGPEVTLPAGAPALDLRVRLDPADRYDRYFMELRSSADQVVWRGDDLRASTESGELDLVAAVPASALADGTYELAVRGSIAGAAPDELGFVTLKVRRSP